MQIFINVNCGFWTDINQNQIQPTTFHMYLLSMVGKPEWKNYSEDLYVDAKKISEWVLWTMLCGSLSPRQSAFAGRYWRWWPIDMESSCEYIDQAVADRRQGVVFHIWGWARGK
jgi:hypothetical protein